MQMEGNTTIDEKPATLYLHTVRPSSQASTPRPPDQMGFPGPYTMAPPGIYGYPQGPVDEPSSPLALYLRFSADFESRVTPPVTVTSSRRPYHSAEVISWHSACSFSHFTCHFTFSLILLFVTHFSGVTYGVTLRAVGLADARWPRRASAALSDFISYFCFLALLTFLDFIVFLLRRC